MKLKECLKKGLCLTLASMLLLTGCSSSETSTTKDASQINEIEEAQPNLNKANLSEGQSELVASLKEKYGATTVDYSSDVIQIDRDESIQYQLEFDVAEKEIESWDDYFCIYQDADMQYPVTSCYMDFDYNNNMLTIEPPTFGIAEISTPDGSDVDLSDLSGKYLYDEETGDNWGNLEELYLVQKLDTNTGEELETPLVTIIKVNTELNKAPKVTYSCNDNGEAQISWSPVEGATDYILFTVMKTEQDGFDSYTNVFARTTETSWTAPKDSLDDGTTYSMNEIFSNYITSEDDVEVGGMEDMNEDFFETMPEYVGVIAVNQTGSSPVSNMISLKDYSKLLPNCFANYENEAEGFDLYQTSIDMLPAEVSVTMCDGSTSRRVIEYDIENAVLDEEFTDPQSLNVLGYASGTTLCKEYTVVVNTETMDADLTALKERQDALKNKGGNVNKDVTIDEENDSVATPTPANETAEPTEEIAEPTEEPSEPTEEPSEPTEEPFEPTKVSESDLNTDIPVTANSALSEYIAIYLLNSAETIDLSMFSESINTDIVVDAFLEAQYQNPLVMGIQDAGYDSQNRILYVSYDDSPEETAAKREEVKEKASEIVSQIISEDMSDLEKEMSINQYLCENAEYDNDALESAEQNDFKTVDDEYLDSFTPYGIIVNGVGVCASYAGAFKVLADEADLECIVVTGYLEGNLPHAWNRVKLDDQWVSLDVTNNDNDIVSNVLMNVADYGVSDVLVEDDRFVLDEKLYDYNCDTDDNEFYHYNNRYYDLDTITDKLTEELSANGSAILRTDYMIDDYAFQDIAQNVANQAGGDIKGYYWLGVIHLSR